MRHKSNNKTRPLFTLSLEMTRLVNETRLLPALIRIYMVYRWLLLFFSFAGLIDAERWLSLRATGKENCDDFEHTSFLASTPGPSDL